MYYAEEFRDGQWWYRTMPRSDWRPGRLEGFSASMERERLADTYEVAP
jgi:hypothetical protein